MSNKKKKYTRESTDDFEYAENNFSIPVNCGECYAWYDIDNNSVCPLCGSDELVGNR
jgi:rubrerythrin